MIHQRPILGDVFGSMQGEVSFALDTEPRSIVNLGSSGAAGAVSVVTGVTTVTEDHIVLMLGVFTQLTRAVIGRQSTGGHHGFGGVPGGIGVDESLRAGRTNHSVASPDRAVLVRIFGIAGGRVFGKHIGGG